ncbi:hypothetical protein EST38_g1643 [Candolleomyces aberdarensis]|uniref:Uncharacterized protein n=1 Tax=Candolleomyces aberdarensis TaxID=2316362 RepID=A0A4Q2DWW1_9AGAR|nr:hypothetical protein EST38_g1643 [Candolleomyces aberdarensis]
MSGHGDKVQAPQGLQMPNVFIVPPEEDEIPAWCCFDAALPIDQRIQGHPNSASEIRVFDPTMGYDDDDDDEAVEAMQAAAVARRNMETRSIVETLMDRDYNIDHAALDSDSDMEWDEENVHQPHPSPAPPKPRFPRTDSDVGNDSDVVEVVKVSRSKRGTDGSDHHSAPPPLTVKRTATFKSRASKVFRSFTGTFRSSSSSSSRARTQHDLPPRPDSSMSSQIRQEEQTVPRPGSRVSRHITQLLTSSSVRSRASVVSYEDSAQDVPAHTPSEPVMPSSRSSSSAGRSSLSDDASPLPRPTSQYPDSIPPDTLSRAASPNPQSNGKTTRRFSKLNLQKMFSFSSTNHDPEPTPSDIPSSGRTTPTLKRKSSSLPSTSSESSAPQTPTSTEDAPPRMSIGRSTLIFDEEGRSPQLDFGEFDSSGLQIVAPSSSGASKHASGDVSFEMKLDSFHFDDLSFDADRFRVD